MKWRDHSPCDKEHEVSRRIIKIIHGGTLPDSETFLCRSICNTANCHHGSLRVNSLAPGRFE